MFGDAIFIPGPNYVVDWDVLPFGGIALLFTVAGLIALGILIGRRVSRKYWPGVIAIGVGLYLAANFIAYNVGIEFIRQSPRDRPDRRFDNVKDSETEPNPSKE